jgi:hypothetical protein
VTLPEVDPGLDIFPAVPDYPSVLVDPELLIRLWLAGQFPHAVVQTETDEALAGQEWTIKVGAGGGSARFTLTTPRVTLDTFAPTRQAARTNALQADHAMRWLLPRSKLGYTTGGPVAVVSKVVQLSGPVHVPDPNTSLRHFAGIYAVTLSPLA